MKNGVTLITPTGGRPHAFNLCWRYIARQTFDGPLQWIIVDDYIPHTLTLSGIDLIKQQFDQVNVIWPTPSWSAGENTLARNLLEALRFVAHEKILFIEDDDWYSPKYIERMAARLDSAEITGYEKTVYYNVPLRRVRTMEHPGRSSLCQTGIRRDVLPIFRKILETAQENLDIHLWDELTLRNFMPSSCVVGMKGMNGRPGIGIGHHAENPYGWQEDSDLSLLQNLIGEDVGLYANI